MEERSAAEERSGEGREHQALLCAMGQAWSELYRLPRLERAVGSQRGSVAFRRMGGSRCGGRRKQNARHEEAGASECGRVESCKRTTAMLPSPINRSFPPPRGRTPDNIRLSLTETASVSSSTVRRIWGRMIIRVSKPSILKFPTRGKLSGVTIRRSGYRLAATRGWAALLVQSPLPAPIPARSFGGEPADKGRLESELTRRLILLRHSGRKPDKKFESLKVCLIFARQISDETCATRVARATGLLFNRDAEQSVCHSAEMTRNR